MTLIDTFFVMLIGVIIVDNSCGSVQTVVNIEFVEWTDAVAGRAAAANTVAVAEPAFNAFLFTTAHSNAAAQPVPYQTYGGLRVLDSGMTTTFPSY